MKSIEAKVSPVSEYWVYAPSMTAQKLFFYPEQCGFFTYEPGYAVHRSAYDSFLIMYIQKGTMLLEFGGQSQTVPEKHFVLLDCYQPHGYATEEGCECLWLHYDGVQARGYYDLIVSRLGNIFSLNEPIGVIRKLNAILRVFMDNLTVREALLSRYITDILTEFLLCSPENTRSRNHAEIAELVMSYVNEHFAEDISVERLADTYGLSVTYFIRVFRQETGYTPHAYIVSRRMASARYLLKYTERSIKEICFSTGFSSESLFCSAFRKQHGMTPQGYRLQGDGGEENPV